VLPQTHFFHAWLHPETRLECWTVEAAIGEGTAADIADAFLE